MPLYEYQCSKCGKTFELMRKFSDPPVTVHEECGGTVEQLLSAPAFQLKGTGWYVTDYAKSGNKGAGAKPETKSESKTESSSGSSDSSGSTKTESKPAATKSE
ncbi:MAG: FmdB family zinc ribbon protein [Bryobacteraceae bacterium]